MLCVHIKVGMAIEPKKLAFLRTETAYYRTSLVRLKIVLGAANTVSDIARHLLICLSHS